MEKTRWSILLFSFIGLLIGGFYGYLLVAQKNNRVKEEVEILDSQLDELHVELERLEKNGFPPEDGVIELGYIASSNSGLEAAVLFLNEIVEPDLNSYVESLGYDFILDFVVKNADSQPTIHLEMVKELKEEGIDIFIGAPWSSMADVTLDYVNDNNMVMVSPSAIWSKHSIPDDRYFRTCLTEKEQANYMAMLIDSWGVTELIIIQRDDEWGDNFSGDFRDHWIGIGNSEPVRIKYPGDTIDFRSFLDELDNDISTATSNNIRYENIGVLALSFSEIGKLAEDLGNYTEGKKVVWFAPVQVNWGHLSQHQSLNHLVDMIFVTPVYEPIKNEAWKELSDRYFSITQNDADIYTCTMYDSAWLLLTAILETRSTNASKISVCLPTISEHKHGITGPMDLNENGDRKYGYMDIWGIAGYFDYLETAQLGYIDGETGKIYWNEKTLRDNGILRPSEI